MRNPRTRGFLGSEMSIANRGSICLKVARKNMLPISLGLGQVLKILRE
ncbi:MAG: hypothetical protein QXE32_05585 [Sulfolobales archaeon]